MEAEIQTTISNLGYIEGDTYYKEPDCFDNIRDLIRVLRNDNREQCRWRILITGSGCIQSDLLPILKQFSADRSLFDAALRLLVNVTQPAGACFSNGKPPQDTASYPLYRQLIRNLQSSKRSLADGGLFAVLTEKLQTYVAQEWEDRQEEDRLVIERILIFVRQALAIPPLETDSMRTDSDVTAQDALWLSLEGSGFIQQLVALLERNEERSFHLYILAIFSTLLLHHSAANVASVGDERTESDRQREAAKLQSALRHDAAVAHQRAQKFSARHSNFAGSYSVKGLPAVCTDNDLVSHRVLPVTGGNGGMTSELGGHLVPTWVADRKTARRTPKNRRQVVDSISIHQSSLSVRKSLRQFVVSLLDGAYGMLMRSCKSLLSGGASERRVDADREQSSYFHLMAFMLEFRRLAGFPFKTIACTASVDAFHFCQTSIEAALELARTDRTAAKQHGIRAQITLAAYKQLLYTMESALKDADSEVRSAASEATEHVFRVSEYRDLTSNLLKAFQPKYLSKTFLQDVVLSTHVYLRMLERMCKQGPVVVTKKTKRRRTRKRKEQHDGAENIDPDVDASTVREDDMQMDEVAEMWNGLTEQLSDLLLDVAAVDVADVEIYDFTLACEDDSWKRRFCLLNVQRALRRGAVEQAVHVFRASRVFWAATDDVANDDGGGERPLLFGSVHCDPEEEFVLMKNICFDDMSQTSVELRRLEKQNSADHQQPQEDLFDERKRFDLDERNEGWSGEEEEEDEFKTTLSEVPLEFAEQVMRYARPDALRWYTSLLASQPSPPAEVCRACLKLLHRVAFDLDSAPLLYQASFFAFLLSVGRTHSKCLSPEMEEVKRFGRHLLRKFFVHARDKPMLYVETLFWKNQKEAYDIQYGYGSHRLKNSAHEPVWTEDTENEMRNLFQEYQEMTEKSEGIDALDFVEHNLSVTRTRRQIYRALRGLGLSTEGLRMKKSKPARVNPWNDELTEQLRELYQQYVALEDKSVDPDIVVFLKEKLSIERTERQIMRQLNTIGLEFAAYRPNKKSKTTWSESELGQLQVLHEEYNLLPEFSVYKPRGLY